MRNILITNDDGLEADGLFRLAEAAQQFGRVWIVAPDGQRSAASHAITLHTHIDVYPASYPLPGAEAFTCSGTPADCVRVGSLNLMPVRPDVVLSGINNGLNVATDLQYSGTAGAAFEAAFQGYHAIAFSEDIGESHAVTDAYLKPLLAELLELRPAAGEIINVNFPACALAECRGVLRGRKVSCGMVYRDTYDEIAKLPGGGLRLNVHGTHEKESEPDTDLRAICDGYVSVGTAKNIS